jgi:hypothetical protein
MTSTKEQNRPNDVHGEFDVPIFVDEYEAIADTFIDTKGAAESLKKLIPPGTALFEIGMGTGYFGQFLSKDGYRVSGIQPNDGMLRRLKSEHPEIVIKGESYIQNHEFDEKYDAIVSHSSIFLFTQPDDPLAQELGTNLIFQSFEKDLATTTVILDKIMAALTPKGKFFINIQPNAHPHSVVNSDLSFGMIACDYNFDSHLVSKVFTITYKGKSLVLDPDISLVLMWNEFGKILENKGYQAEISPDEYWVIISGKK